MLTILFLTRFLFHNKKKKQKKDIVWNRRGAEAGLS